MSLAGGVRELLRPPPHRGPLIAAGAMALAVGIALEELRLQDRLPDVLHMLVLLLVGGLIFWLRAQAANEGGEPPAYQSVLLVTGAFLLYAGLLITAGVLGADFGDLPSGALLWTPAVLGALLLCPAFERSIAMSLSLAALLGGVAQLAACAFVFGSSSA